MTLVSLYGTTVRTSGLARALLRQTGMLRWDPSSRGFASVRTGAGATRRLREREQPHLLLRVGLPFVFFSILAAWVVSNALDGKLKEMEASQGRTSQSLRQAALAQEHDEMMERLNKIVAQDFDNQKRIKRPHEVLEERRLERERRNAWHRRAYRAIFGGDNIKKEE